jgi:cytochrome c-type biogenesis protein CcmE
MSQTAQSKHMHMTRKSRRLTIIVACAIGLGSAALLTMSAFRQNLVFFMAPSDILRAHVDAGRTIRLGGMVEAGSVARGNDDGTPVAQFRVTDGKAAIAVNYRGILPDLFREGQGIVALGVLKDSAHFEASEVLAKHDETYMPKDVADALKKSGHWNPAKGAPAPSSLWTGDAVKTVAPGG